MTQTTKQITPKLRRGDMDKRTHAEEEPPLTPDEARRQLGFDLLPFNGGDREDND